MGKYQNDIKCQIDTGSTCNLMSFRELCSIAQNGNPKMKKSNAKLKLYDGSNLEPIGKATISCTRNGKTYDLEFQIVDVEQHSLISAETCEKINIIKLTDDSVHMISNKTLTREQILREYNGVFTGLRCLSGEYHLEIDKSVKPVQHQPRRVAALMKQAVKQKISDLEKMGIITKVTEPTEWISSMVVVKKPSKFRICLDPKDLNKALQRSHYPMPTIDEILPRLSNAKVFSVLDTKDGFWQIKFDKESSMLTTFWTPFGRYRWLRMPFGINTAPEEFERRQHEALSGLNGVDVIIDDILVFGSGETEEEAMQDHDENLRNLLDRARKVNLKLNKNKLNLRCKEVPYIGHLLTKDGLKPDPQKDRAIQDMPRPTDVQSVRFLGFVNYLSKFLPKISEVSEPL